MKQNSRKARVAQSKPSYSQLARKQGIVVAGWLAIYSYVTLLYFTLGLCTFLQACEVQKEGGVPRHGRTVAPGIS